MLNFSLYRIVTVRELHAYEVNHCGTRLSVIEVVRCCVINLQFTCLLAYVNFIITSPINKRKTDQLSR